MGMGVEGIGDWSPGFCGLGHMVHKFGPAFEFGFGEEGF